MYFIYKCIQYTHTPTHMGITHTQVVLVRHILIEFVLLQQAIKRWNARALAHLPLVGWLARWMVDVAIVILVTIHSGFKCSNATETPWKIKSTVPNRLQFETYNKTKLQILCKTVLLKFRMIYMFTFQWRNTETKTIIVIRKLGKLILWMCQRKFKRFCWERFCRKSNQQNKTNSDNILRFYLSCIWFIVFGCWFVPDSKWLPLHFLKAIIFMFHTHSC